MRIKDIPDRVLRKRYTSHSICPNRGWYGRSLFSFILDDLSDMQGTIRVAPPLARLPAVSSIRCALAMLQTVR